jgi:hypothetical protein
MTADNTVSRSLHDLGLATWFGGSLMGAVLVVNARMGEQQRPTQVTGGLLSRLRPGRAA